MSSVIFKSPNALEGQSLPPDFSRFPVTARIPLVGMGVKLSRGRHRMKTGDSHDLAQA